MKKLEKKSCERWATKDYEFTVTLTHSRIKGLYPKYFITSKNSIKGKYANTLKEAQQIINNWN